MSQLIDLGTFKSFVIQNGLIVAIAGITVGTSTKDVIKAFTIDILMPFFRLIVVEGMMKGLHQKYYVVSKKILGDGKFLWIAFLKELVTWVFIVLIAYVLIEFFFNKLFTSENPNDEKVVEENKKFFKFQHSIFVPNSESAL